VSWDDMQKGEAQPSENAKRLRELFGLVFQSPEGLELLARLREETVERPLPSDVPERALAFLEGQRQLVLAIERRAANALDLHPTELRRRYPALGPRRE